MNDHFEVYAEQATIESIQLFNRWGELVYEGLEAWDGYIKGTAAAEGLYVYVIAYTEDVLRRPKQKVGEVVLMR